MKRCPQCEFIYEDDQSLCDMDGELLVLDSRTLPNQQALTTITKATKPKPRRKRAVPAFASLILVAVLGMVYYGSTQRQEAQSSYTPPAVTTISVPVPEVNPSPQVETVQPVEEPKPEEVTSKENKPEPSKQRAASQPSRKSSVKAASITPTNAPAKKEDSKVGSILKKTGRILKKPFKL